MQRSKPTQPDRFGKHAVVHGDFAFYNLPIDGGHSYCILNWEFAYAADSIASGQSDRITAHRHPGLNEVHLGDWQHGLFEMRMATADPICMDIFAQERWDLVPAKENSAGE